MTLAGGALLLACKDPQPVAAAILGQNSTAGVNSSTRNGHKEERQTNGGVDKTSGGGTGGKEAVENVLGRDAASAGSEKQTPGETGGDESRGKPHQQQQQQRQSGGGAVLSGKEASLLVGYLRAAALTAAETGRAQEGSVAGPSGAAAAAAPLFGEEDGGKEDGGKEDGGEEEVGGRDGEIFVCGMYRDHFVFFAVCGSFNVPRPLVFCGLQYCANEVRRGGGCLCGHVCGVVGGGGRSSEVEGLH